MDVNETQIVRQAAGIQLKNCLVAKTHAVKEAYQERWFALDESIRTSVKAQVRIFTSKTSVIYFGEDKIRHCLKLWPQLFRNHNSVC